MSNNPTTGPLQPEHNETVHVAPDPGELPEVFLEVQATIKKCCANCMFRGEVSGVDGYVKCENKDATGLFLTSSRPDTHCDKFKGGDEEELDK